MDSYYSNITGFIHGDAVFSNITLLSLASNETLASGWKQEAESLMSGVNTTNITDKLGSWNWAASTKAALSVLEKLPPSSNAPSFENGQIALIHVSLPSCCNYLLILFSARYRGGLN